MGKGSFHNSANPPSNEAPTAAADEMVRHIALPTELPEGIDFSELSGSEFKSSTLETLMTQNEDLMARLNLSLRRTRALEERQSQLERESVAVRSKFETLREQCLLLQEKDRVANQRTQQLLGEGQTARQHVQKLEKAYSDIFVQAQALQKRLVLLERYRARIRKTAPNFQAKAKRLAAIDQDLGRLQADFVTAKKTMAVTNSQMVNSYEAKLTELREQLVELSAKARERDQAIDERVKIENQKIFENRQHQAQREENERRISSLESAAQDLRLQLKDALVSNESKHRELENLHKQQAANEDELMQLRDQVESLQTLWTHKQRELDTLEQKNESLQRLNQSLSVNMNQQRKEIHGLKTEMEQERYRSDEQIKALLAEVQMLRRERNS